MERTKSCLPKKLIVCRNKKGEGVLHGGKLLKELIAPWAQSDRLVYANSYFESVGAIEELVRMRFHFIDVLKTATCRSPMEYLLTFQRCQGY